MIATGDSRNDSRAPRVSRGPFEGSRKQTPAPPRRAVLRMCPRRWHRRLMKSTESSAASTGLATGQRSEPKLLDRVREAIRVRHYSRRTEEAYVTWIRRFIVFHGKKHPSEMGGHEIGWYLTYLAVERKVSASTQTRRLVRFCFCIGRSFVLIPERSITCRMHTARRACRWCSASMKCEPSWRNPRLQLRGHRSHGSLVRRCDPFELGEP